MKNIVAVGIDLSLTSTGILVLRGHGTSYRTGSGPEVLRQVRILTKDLRGYPRIDLIAEEVVAIDKWLTSRELRAKVYVCEAPAFSSKLASTLGLLHGVVKMDLLRGGADEDAAVLDVWPSTLKKFVTGKGSGDKDVMMKWVHKRWGFDSDCNDENDAYACAMVGLCLYGEESPAAHRKLLEGKVEVHARSTVQDSCVAKVIVSDPAAAASTAVELPAAAPLRAVAGRFRRRVL